MPNGCDICGRNYRRCWCLCLSVCLAGCLTCLYWRRSKGVPVPIKHHAIKTLDVEVQLRIFLAVAIDWRLVTCYRLPCEVKRWMERSRQVGEIFVFRSSGFKSRSCGRLSCLWVCVVLFTAGIVLQGGPRPSPCTFFPVIFNLKCFRRR